MHRRNIRTLLLSCLEAPPKEILPLSGGLRGSDGVAEMERSLSRDLGG